MVMPHRQGAVDMAQIELRYGKTNAAEDGQCNRQFSGKEIKGNESMAG
jgi:hypothetical protein